MKTGFKDLDKTIKIDKPQVILITSTDEIENVFALNLVKNMAIDENIKTALFTNIELANKEEQFRIYTKDILASICSTVNINKIIDTRYLKKVLTKEEVEITKIKGKTEVLFDEDNGQKLYITKEILDNEEEKRVNESYKKINNAPLYINTVEGITINEFKEKCRNLKLENDIQLIVTSTAIINDTKINVLKTINKLAEELKITILVTTLTIENNNIPLKQELKELVEIMNIADITIYLKLGNEEEKDIVHCIVDTKNKKNIINFIYLTEYNKFVDLIEKYQNTFS